MPWRTIKHEDDRPLLEWQLETMVRGFFAPELLLDYIRYFVLFETDNDKLNELIDQLTEITDGKRGTVTDLIEGIDQGPIMTMIENYRSEIIWRTMQRNPYIRRGLERAGFTGGWLAKQAQTDSDTTGNADDTDTGP